MSKGNTKIIRVDATWEKKAREIMTTRYNKGLAKLKIEELSPAEFTRLQLRCPSWIKVEEELKNLPKRRNGK